MKSIPSKPIDAITYYRPLLLRYAMRATNDKDSAEKITLQVLNDVYDLDRQEPSPYLHEILLTAMRNCCFCWKQIQIFNRPVLKVPYTIPYQPNLIITNNTTVN